MGLRAILEAEGLRTVDYTALIMREGDLRGLGPSVTTGWPQFAAAASSGGEAPPPEEVLFPISAAFYCSISQKTKLIQD